MSSDWINEVRLKGSLQILLLEIMLLYVTPVTKNMPLSNTVARFTIGMQTEWQSAFSGRRARKRSGTQIG
jgi:hypothetical protein